MNFDDEYELKAIYKTDVESIKKLSLKSPLSAITYSTLKAQLKNRKIKPEENKAIVEFELNNRDSNTLLKNILEVIE